MSKECGRYSEGFILLYMYDVLHDWISLVKHLQIFFGSKSTNIMSKQRKISTRLVFIFHELPQIILTPKYLKNSKYRNWCFAT